MCQVPFICICQLGPYSRGTDTVLQVEEILVLLQARQLEPAFGFSWSSGTGWWAGTSPPPP